MACAVRSCRNEVVRRPDLSFFSLPNHQDVRDEWLEVLGIDRPDFIKRIKVCELHFKPKDFSGKEGGKKQLKSHAIPVLKLGPGKSDIIDSDDEFMEYKSESDQEIVEIPKPKVAKKEELQETPETNEEPAVGRRPSRRAAREAAKKIHNTVRNFMPTKAEDDDVYMPFTGSPSAMIKHPISVSRSRKRNSVFKTSRPPEIDLVMECHEETISTVQAEALLKSQWEYNMVMKTLRSLKASNAKIIFSKEPYTGVPPAVPGTPVPLSSVAPVPLSSVASVPLSSVASVPLKLVNNPAIQITKTPMSA